MNSRVVPFTTRTGLQIGRFYEPPRNYVVSGDMEDLQTALLHGKPRMVRPSFLTRLFRIFRTRSE